MSLYQKVKQIFEEHQGEEFETNDGALLNVTLPKEYAELPEFTTPDQHEKLTENEQVEYFAELESGDMRIWELNGQSTEEDDCDYSPVFRCDICGEEIVDNKRYSNYIDEGLEGQNLCCDCAETDGGKEMIKKHQLICLLNNSISTDDADFGSLLDWVPIFRNTNEPYDQVLVNVNRESPCYGRVSLMASDDHERQGYGVLNSNISLDDAIMAIQKYQENLDDKKEGWDEVYCSSIKKYMRENHMNVHFD